MPARCVKSAWTLVDIHAMATGSLRTALMASRARPVSSSSEAIAVAPPRRAQPTWTALGVGW
jgi:hypothetical protein